MNLRTTRSLNNTVHDTTTFMLAAANALIERDTMAIAELGRISDGWLQQPAESRAQMALLNAIMEAACLLEGEPSELTAGDDEPSAA